MPIRTAFAATAVAAIALAPAASVMAAEPAEVVATYTDIAHATYADSLATAETLDAVIRALLEAPSASGLEDARAAWLAARVPYQQSEVFRFGNVLVDEWEGKVNSWPLDEGLIDYVDAGLYGEESDLNAFYTVNIIAHPEITVGGETIDATTIDAELIRSLQEVDEVEANVTTGYHAIEFLLWGQDLNGTGPGAGDRPWTDYATGDACTGGNCDRRGDYLGAASALLVADLRDMVAAWGADGAARTTLTTEDPTAGLAAIFTGMGSLSYGELAGERMQLGLMLHDPEEEQDCFSDNTHNSHFYDGLGIRNVYLGRYERIDGSTVEGASPADLVAAADPALDKELRTRLDAAVAALGAVKAEADSGASAYDQMIGEGNATGNALVQAAIDALVDQTRSIERAVAVLGLDSLELEGSDSLDQPDAVFQ